jgi:hypothetical protein
MIAYYFLFLINGTPVPSDYSLVIGSLKSGPHEVHYCGEAERDNGSFSCEDTETAKMMVTRHIGGRRTPREVKISYPPGTIVSGKTTILLLRKFRRSNAAYDVFEHSVETSNGRLCLSNTLFDETKKMGIKVPKNIDLCSPQKA